MSGATTSVLGLKCAVITVSIFYSYFYVNIILRTSYIEIYLLASGAIQSHEGLIVFIQYLPV